jgi:hypothetical protein
MAMITTRPTPTPIPALAPSVRPPFEVTSVGVVVGLDELELLEGEAEVLEMVRVVAGLDSGRGVAALVAELVVKPMVEEKLDPSVVTLLKVEVLALAMIILMAEEKLGPSLTTTVKVEELALEMIMLMVLAAAVVELVTARARGADAVVTCIAAQRLIEAPMKQGEHAET